MKNVETYVSNTSIALPFLNKSHGGQEMGYVYKLNLKKIVYAIVIKRTNYSVT